MASLFRMGCGNLHAAGADHQLQEEVTCRTQLLGLLPAILRALFGRGVFDWLVIDTIWVALSGWRLIPFSVPPAAIVGAIYWLVGRLL